MFRLIKDLVFAWRYKWAVKKAVETGREVINLFTGEVITDITALQNNYEPNKPNIK